LRSKGLKVEKPHNAQTKNTLEDLEYYKDTHVKANDIICKSDR